MYPDTCIGHCILPGEHICNHNWCVQRTLSSDITWGIYMYDTLSVNLNWWVQGKLSTITWGIYNALYVNHNVCSSNCLQTLSREYTWRTTCICGPYLVCTAQTVCAFYLGHIHIQDTLSVNLNWCVRAISGEYMAHYLVWTSFQKNFPHIICEGYRRDV